MVSFADQADRAARYERQRQQQRAHRPLDTSARRTYEQLRASIRSGLTHPQTRFEELAISEEFGASRNSVRRAFAMLSGDGLINRGPRHGTVVVNRIVDFPVDRELPRDFSGYSHSRNGLVVVDVELAVLPTPAEVAACMDTTAPRIRSYEQLGVLAGQPIYLRSGIAPVTGEEPGEFFDVLAGIDDMGADGRIGDFEAVFLALFGVELGDVRTRIEVVGADDRLAGLLGVERGAPLLLRQQYTYDVDGVAREFSFTHFRGDRVTLSGHSEYADGVRTTARER